MSWVGVAVGVAGVVGSVISANKASSATDEANQNQLNMYGQNRTDQLPWIKAGQTAVGQLGAGTQPGGQFTQSFQWDPNSDPGYAARMNAATKALDRSATGSGQLYSGGAGKTLSRYAQEYASNEYNNAFNRFQTTNTNQFNQLASIAGLGQTSANQIGQMGYDTAGQVGKNLTSNAAYQGAATMTGINSATNALNEWQKYKMMKGSGTDNYFDNVVAAAPTSYKNYNTNPIF